MSGCRSRAAARGGSEALVEIVAQGVPGSLLPGQLARVDQLLDKPVVPAHLDQLVPARVIKPRIPGMSPESLCPADNRRGQGGAQALEPLVRGGDGDNCVPCVPQRLGKFLRVDKRPAYPGFQKPNRCFRGKAVGTPPSRLLWPARPCPPRATWQGNGPDSPTADCP